MSALAAFAYAAVLGQAPLQSPSLAARFREACVATQMRREPFDAVFAGRGLEPLLMVVRPGEDWKLLEWMAGYEDQGVQMVMSGVTAIDRSRATDCATFDPAPQGDWRSDIEALAVELEMTSIQSPVKEDMRDARSWAAAGERPLSLHYEVYDYGVVVRFEQPMEGHD